MKFLDLSIEDLYNTYTELPNQQATLKVKDKNAYIPNDDETKLVKPIGKFHLSKLKSCRVRLKILSQNLKVGDVL